MTSRIDAGAARVPPLRRALVLRAIAGLMSLALCGCQPDRQPTSYQPTYGSGDPQAQGPERVFAVHPLHAPKKLFEAYQPLVDHLNAQVPEARLRLQASDNYAAFEKKLRDGALAFALPNPYQTLLAQESGYRVFAKMGQDADFRGVVLVRRDAGIRSARQLAGKAVSYPAPTALAATLLPQRWLHDEGVDVGRLDNRYVGSQESAIMNVVLGRTAAGATWPQPWRLFQKEQPHLAAQLEVLTMTAPLVNNALVAHPDVPEPLVQKLQAALVSMADTPDGRRVLAHLQVAPFERADGRTYDKVRTFVAAFERDVRPIKQD